MLVWSILDAGLHPHPLHPLHRKHRQIIPQRNGLDELIQAMFDQHKDFISGMFLDGDQRVHQTRVTE